MKRAFFENNQDKLLQTSLSALVEKTRVESLPGTLARFFDFNPEAFNLLVMPEECLAESIHLYYGLVLDFYYHLEAGNETVAQAVLAEIHQRKQGYLTHAKTRISNALDLEELSMGEKDKLLQALGKHWQDDLLIKLADSHYLRNTIHHIDHSNAPDIFKLFSKPFDSSMENQTLDELYDEIKGSYLNGLRPWLDFLQDEHSQKESEQQLSKDLQKAERLKNHLQGQPAKTAVIIPVTAPAPKARWQDFFTTASFGRSILTGVLVALAISSIIAIIVALTFTGTAPAFLIIGGAVGAAFALTGSLGTGLGLALVTAGLFSAIALFGASIGALFYASTCKDKAQGEENNAEANNHRQNPWNDKRLAAKKAPTSGPKTVQDNAAVYDVFATETRDIEVQQNIHSIALPN